MTVTVHAAEPWWHGFFDDDYANHALAPDEATSAPIAAFLLEALQLHPGSTVLDQCCGLGRLSLALAQRGVRVIGVDRVASYIERAQQEARRQGLAMELYCADALTFVAPRPCDAAFNWFTSFGYHEDDSVNARMLERAFQSLRPGGRMALDYVNMPGRLAHLRPAFAHLPPDGNPRGLIVVEEPVPDYARGMIDSTWTFIHPDGRRERRRVCTRMYMPHEIVSLLGGCGFEDVRLHGGPDGQPFTVQSPRCIAVARRP